MSDFHFLVTLKEKRMGLIVFKKNSSFSFILYNFLDQLTHDISAVL